MAWHDAQYLFRLTSTFGWDDVESLCNELISGIQRAAEPERYSTDRGVFINQLNDSLRNDEQSHSSDKRSAEDWLRHATEQLYYQDQWLNTPLHAALYVQPPLNTINALLKVGRVLWKYSINKPNLPIWAMPSNDNSTPFLVACSTGTNVAGLKRYLDEVDYYIEQGWVSPHARLLVLQPDNQGVTPFAGWMAFHRGCISSSHSGMKLETEAAIHAGYKHLVTEMLWFATMHVYPEYPATNEMLFQRCAFIALQFPHYMLPIVLVGESNDVAMIRDNRNQLPLHLAMSAVEVLPSSFNDLIQFKTNNMTSSLETYYNHDHEINQTLMIDDILRRYPNAAKIHFPNGRYPLCEALARGNRWYLASEKTNRCMNGMIQMLCEHAPDNLQEKDSITGLYPFMFAATIPLAAKDNRDERCIVETVYELLRLDPQPVSHSILKKTSLYL